MELSLDSSSLRIDSEKKQILFTPPTDFTLDSMSIEVPGEYEKGGFLCYARECQSRLIIQVRIEWLVCVFVPVSTLDLSGEILDWLSTVDVLILPASRASIPMIEKIEPRSVVALGDLVLDFVGAVGVSDTPVSRAKLRESDLSGDQTSYIIMGEEK